MSTLIAAYNSDGCIGRCDARCYEATTPECDCICGGVNHGAGFKVAVENTRAMGDAWMQRYQRQHAGQALRFDAPAFQGELFTYTPASGE